jgi:hypothetical protein
MDQLAGSVAYNVPHAVRFRGGLRVAALGWALGEVVARHEVLRTCYPVVAGRVVQRVGPAGFRLGWRDVSGLPDPEGALWERARQEACEPFELAAGPVLRGELVRVAADDHVLLLTVHHIASDGWSSGVLVREVLELYPRFGAGGGGAVLAPLPVQYADFAVWQRGWLRGEVLADLVGYWRERLAGASVLRLPTDRPRPAVLSRLTGQTDVTIGTATSGRRRAGLESLVGFFVNTMVLRTDLSGDPTFRELLGRVRETLLGSYAHQDLPFEKLVQELRPAQVGRAGFSPWPFFEIVFQLDDTAPGLPMLDDVTAEPLFIDKGVVKLPLIVTMSTVGDGSLDCGVEYMPDLIGDDDVSRLLEIFLGYLQAFTEDIGRPLRSLLPELATSGGQVGPRMVGR